MLRVILNTLKNPIILAAILGTIYSALSFPLPKLFETFAHLLAASVTPCALFAVGLDIDLKNVRANWFSITLFTAVKLVLLPLCVLGLSFWMNLAPFEAISAVLIATVPIAKTVFVLSNQYDIEKNFTAALTAATELASIATMFIWILVLTRIWPAEFAHAG